MTLLDHLMKEAIAIDFGEEILYTSDYVQEPGRIKKFAVVQLELMETPGLVAIADQIRRENGIGVGRKNETGWYNFYIDLNTYSDTHLGDVINFVVVNSDFDDNEDMYRIEIGEPEGSAIYNQLNAQLRKHLGKTCHDLLMEAERAMEAKDA